MVAIGMELVLRPIYRDEVAASNPYDLLKVAEDADRQAIQKAYRRLVRRYHPDVCKRPGALWLYEEIVKAYEIVGAPDYQLHQRLLSRFDHGEW